MWIVKIQHPISILKNLEAWMIDETCLNLRSLYDASRMIKPEAANDSQSIVALAKFVSNRRHTIDAEAAMSAASII